MSRRPAKKLRRSPVHDEQALPNALKLVAGSYWTEWRQLRLLLLPHTNHSGLHILPKEVLQRIAQMAHSPRPCPRFEVSEGVLSDDAEGWEEGIDAIRNAVHVHDDGHKLSSFVGSLSRTLHIPWGKGFQYFELGADVWGGTTIQIQKHELIFEYSRADDDGCVAFLDGRHIGAWGPRLMEDSHSFPNDQFRGNFGFLISFDREHVCPHGGVRSLRSQILLSLNGLVGPRLDLEDSEDDRSKGFTIAILDEDARGLKKPVCDVVQAPVTVPMRMADPSNFNMEPHMCFMCDGCQHCYEEEDATA